MVIGTTDIFLTFTNMTDIFLLCCNFLAPQRGWIPVYQMGLVTIPDIRDRPNFRKLDAEKWRNWNLENKILEVGEKTAHHITKGSSVSAKLFPWLGRPLLHSRSSQPECVLCKCCVSSTGREDRNSKMLRIWSETSCDRSKAMLEQGTERLITYCSGIRFPN